MPGKKRKSVTEVQRSTAYRRKLRKTTPPPETQKLPDEECKEYTITSPYPQDFSLPTNVLFYVAKNLSSVYDHLKFISICKSFARMSRILPVKRFVHYSNDDLYKWRAGDKSIIILKDLYFKLWIYDGLRIVTKTLPNLASTLARNVYKSSISHLHIENQVLTFGEFQLLVGGDKLDDIYFKNNVVKNADGSITEFEKVFELLCCRKINITFHLEHHGIGKNTTSEIIEILSSNQIPSDICLMDIPQNFNLRLFSDYLKANMTCVRRQTIINLDFSNGISGAYKNELQQILNEILQVRAIHRQNVPLIGFPGQSSESRLQLQKKQYPPPRRGCGFWG